MYNVDYNVSFYVIDIKNTINRKILFAVCSQNAVSYITVFWSDMAAQYEPQILLPNNGTMFSLTII